MDVAIIGAAGKIGRAITPAFETDRTSLFTHSEHADVASDGAGSNGSH